ncbi:hypothetical protein SAMN05421869_111361 [Nonomuraea jiangxiensis]|uniref:Uncharacterized protein n=1 Tax=Nonomuraea jiangxiensis TaxID=633440 RepID=A0A1G8VMC9_9ACTN|nr:hypothetical protein SAMN05421869_111361 [Nonomuraea jiangxiensis]
MLGLGSPAGLSPTVCMLHAAGTANVLHMAGMVNSAEEGLAGVLTLADTAGVPVTAGVPGATIVPGATGVPGVAGIAGALGCSRTWGIGGGPDALRASDAASVLNAAGALDSPSVPDPLSPINGPDRPDIADGPDGLYTTGAAGVLGSACMPDVVGVVGTTPAALGGAGGGASAGGKGVDALVGRVGIGGRLLGGLVGDRGGGIPREEEGGRGYDLTPSQKLRAAVVSASPGVGLSARSARVQETRTTRSRPRAVRVPESKQDVIGFMAAGDGR